MFLAGGNAWSAARLAMAAVPVAIIGRAVVPGGVAGGVEVWTEGADAMVRVRVGAAGDTLADHGGDTMRTALAGTTTDGLGPSSAVRPIGVGVIVMVQLSPEAPGADHALPSR